jgi:pyruvate,water dikinase
VIWQGIRSGHSDTEFATAIGQYLERFGTRFTNELKLEEPSINEQPEKFINLIKMYLRLPQEKVHVSGKDRDHSKRQAEDIVRKKLNPLQHALLVYVLKRTKHFLKNREDTRLMRAKIFGFVRDIFKSIGKKLESRKSIDAAEDIFYLELEEAIQYIEGSAAFTDLRSLIVTRKKEFDRYRSETLPSRFMTRGIPYLNLPEAKKPLTRNNDDLTLKGLPCSPGQTEGIVAVMENVSYTIPEGATILVARHTDPGWTTIFSRFDGIIVENGGQLSHAAIVSRELGIPCVVGIENIMDLVRNGDRLQLDGSLGEVHIKKKS